MNGNICLRIRFLHTNIYKFLFLEKKKKRKSPLDLIDCVWLHLTDPKQSLVQMEIISEREAKTWFPGVTEVLRAFLSRKRSWSVLHNSLRNWEWLRQVLEGWDVEHLHKPMIWNPCFGCCEPLVLIKHRSQAPSLRFSQAPHEATSSVLSSFAMNQ